MNILFLLLCAVQPERFEALPRVFHIVHAENINHKDYVLAKTDGQPFKVPIVNGIIPSVVQYKDEWGNVTRREFYYDRKVLYTGQEVLDYNNPQEVVEITEPPPKTETPLPKDPEQILAVVQTIAQTVAQIPPEIPATKEEQNLFKDVPKPQPVPATKPKITITVPVAPNIAITAPIKPQPLPPATEPTDQTCVTPCVVNNCQNYCVHKCKKVHRKCRR